MNTVKNVTLMAMGSMVTLAYQKYNKPIKKAINKALNKTDSMLENVV